MENCALQQISTQDNIPLRLYISLLENTVEIIIFQEEDAWKSTIIKNKLQYFADEYKMTLEDYCSKLLDYVKNAYPNVIYVFKDEEFAINRLLENSLTVKYFTCKVEKVDYVTHVEQTMDKMYLENTRLCDDLLVLQKEREQMVKDKNDCESKLKLLTNKKIVDESELIGRFVLVLNEKKRRIQHLTELLEAFKQGRPTTNPEVKVANRARKKEIKNPVQKKETISESESSDAENYNSDAEKSDSGHPLQSNSSRNKVESTEESKPSTSAGSLDFLDDNFEQPFHLPKRVKRTQENDVLVAAAPSNSPPKVKEPEVPELSKSPEIDLSTQQLLDML